MKKIKFIPLFLTLFFSLVFSSSNLQAEITTRKINENLILLKVDKFNSVLFSDDKLSILVNSEHTAIDAELLNVIKDLTGKPLDFIIYTHFHGDEQQDQILFDNKPAIYVIHKNTLKRITKDEELNPLKNFNVISFEDKFDLSTNSEEIQIIHLPKAHTDGDLVVYFKKSNVFFTGNLFYSKSYPFIDTISGGTISGYIDALNSITKIIDGKTVVIPGNGKSSNKDVVKKFKKMIVNSRNRIELQIHAEKQLNIILDEKPLSDFDSDRWGRGIISSRDFVKNLYRALKKAE